MNLDEVPDVLGPRPNSSRGVIQLNTQPDRGQSPQMSKSPRLAGRLIQVELGFCLVAIAMATLGILSIANEIRGGVALGVLALVAAVALFGIAGYFVWAYHWVTRNPDRLRQAEGERVIRSRLQRAPDEPTVNRDSDA